MSVQELVKEIQDAVEKYGTFKRIQNSTSIELEDALQIVKAAPYYYIVERKSYADDNTHHCLNCGSVDCDDINCSDFPKQNGCRLCGSDDCECGHVIVFK